MTTVPLERVIEAKVLGEEGYGLLTAPWELVQAVRWRVFESRRDPFPTASSSWLQTAEEEQPRPRAA